jgi:D-alanyl-D-alanine carboxypeptidase (penicillin-binding protein 5/6)
MLLRIVLLLALLLPLAVRADAPPPPPIAAKAWLLMDTQSGSVIASQNATARAEPASLTKLMTAYLVFSALQQKKLTLDQTVNVSEKAWKIGGSRMFIEPRKPVTVDELLRGMIVQSGNDATVALAEAVAGSEEVFAQMMNREARRLGMKDTNFTNSTGWPDPKHYTTVNDLALNAAALIRDFPDLYAKYYSMKDYRYNNITQPNRNRLLWLDPNVDGVKTGHTDAAGYCLIASARRGDRRMLSVVLGTASDAARAQESQKLLNYGFQFFDTVRLFEANKPVGSVRVYKGAENEVKAGMKSDLYLTVPKGEGDRLKADFVSQQPLLAPVSAGQQVGVVRVTREGKPAGDYSALALESVPMAGFFGRMADTVRLWVQ